MNKISTKPYFIRAIFDWCVDNNYSPYIFVDVNKDTIVPINHIQNGKIILNISNEATNNLIIDNIKISFQTRFNGVLENIFIPIDRIISIYAQETGEGMQFTISEEVSTIKKEKKSFSIVE
ncbi:stringent starvation protein B [Candidatus Kinetoplastibacterium desouzaii TCC079E]|uniref:Stringent starvation protein B n=1 Tax=Candidatus Kinetoplastidibacterium desouzai TCC079E TaxID=1208919 RepID=M1LTA8_9PROT|nr:ClpXP protease specificity-enhancing factor [Candidatus Kinetoplastibacterium desouzaii]AGF46574.1 stringent starvation protein B [Candidatus Kinetoplastibacterium desouzaii TCC079E]